MECVSNETQIKIDGDNHVEAPVPYASVEHVCSVSSSSLCCSSVVGSHSVMSKKVKAHKLPLIEQFEVKGSGVSTTVDCCRLDGYKLRKRRPEIVHVYCRRGKRSRRESSMELVVALKDVVVKAESLNLDDANAWSEEKQKKRRIGNSKFVKLDVDSNSLRSSTRPGLRGCTINNALSGNKQNGPSLKKEKSVKNEDKVSLASASAKRWVRLSYDGVDPKSFIGLQCKVFWPMDSVWYPCSIVKYNLERKHHSVLYEDGFDEDIVLDRELIKFFVSREEMKLLHLKFCTNDVTVGGQDYDEMVVLAANLEGCQDFEPEDIVWAKLAGHAMWPALIVDESVFGERKGLNKKVSGGGSLFVQFFGTHDFARIKIKQATSFSKGLLLSSHLKCKQPRFEEAMHEAKMYLKEHTLPKRMGQLQKGADSDCSERTINTEECSSNSGRDHNTGYRPVPVDWKDLDKCNVCHTDEECENNLFLQCDKCRMMVHATCYGELEPCDGALWLCNLCRPDAPDIPPRCSLCPVVGGAMKPTTDGRWAHLACAIWIPETCFSDVKKMEPIDGVNKVSKARWKLLCSICEVSYGACIQCSNNSCRVAYHPLCARAAGLCFELEDEDRLFLLSSDDEEADTSIRMLSFCKRHRQTSTACLESKNKFKPVTHKTSEYLPPPNPSGCARTEPYDCLGRRGQKEPESLAAASSKRLFVENQPYIIGGFSRHEFSTYECIQGSKVSQINTPSNIQSMAEKYRYMKETYRKRLAFGKSRIHNFGIFAKLPQLAGDMVIEYTGELIRPSIADKRERLIYNSIVGAGTYMFKIDDERVVDATRAGSIAHLINHSCVPNCYSRVISVNGDEHIIIFAKRDIPKWEELSYDYRFFSIGERLSCSCGFPGCRGVVNDTEAEEQQSKIWVSRSDLIECTPE